GAGKAGTGTSLPESTGVAGGGYLSPFFLRAGRSDVRDRACDGEPLDCRRVELEDGEAAVAAGGHGDGCLVGDEGLHGAFHVGTDRLHRAGAVEDEGDVR